MTDKPKVVDFQQKKAEKSASDFAQNLVDRISSSPEIELETNVLNAVLQRAENIIYYSGGERGVDGVMKKVDPAQLLKAASRQTFTVESMPDIGTLKAVFDDDYQYAIQMEPTVTVDYFDKAKTLLAEESMRNTLWKREQARQIGIPSLPNDLSWMNSPLPTVALSMVLNKSESITRGEVENGVVVFHDVPVSEVMELASKALVNMSFAPENNVLTMSVNDENDTLFFAKVSRNVGPGLRNHLVDACIEESKDNFKFVRENDPGLDDIKANMAKANAWLAQQLDDDQELRDALGMDDPGKDIRATDAPSTGEPEIPAPDNVRPMRRR